MSTSNQTQDRLLHVLAEQLKLPLLQIARQAELADQQSLGDIAYIAQNALGLIDAYVLSLQTEDQTALSFEPVSVSALLQETAHQLAPYAKRYHCDLQLHLAGRYEPVMADAAGLQSALMVLGQSFIEAEADGNKTVLLAAHRSSRGIVAGVFGNQEPITMDSFRRARALFGTARQPLSSSSANAAAGIFVADNLLRRMSAPLHAARHHKLTGLAATLLPSRQLELAGV